ncbi:colon cancer-associated protein mic1 [Anaeramoeba flamelloides]|uniref:Colon cancer-associated protein mic1 n=1 Tax=Anaeramoeba flamelloides TaxID=1746091 RepID=A0AAV7ZAZ5_9EUKA|nr:colon cancer-associated protein mic1 [Anaeramoeba flamelloides]KAJ6251742.1 colon cancer-associated protein mic1 [Anaeramoeba flamelloides]
MTTKLLCSCLGFEQAIYFNPQLFRYFRFDDGIEQLVVVYQTIIGVVEKKGWVKPISKIPQLEEDDLIKEIRISSDRMLICVYLLQNSKPTMKIISLSDKKHKTIDYFSVHSNLSNFYYHSFRWISKNSILFVHNYGVDYRKKEKNILLLYLSNKSKTIFTVRITERELIKMGKFQLSENAFRVDQLENFIYFPYLRKHLYKKSQINFPEYQLALSQNLKAMLIYNDLYLIHLINTKQKRKIELYQVNDNLNFIKQEININGLSTRYGVSIIDNVLLITDVHSRRTVICDLMTLNIKSKVITNLCTYLPHKVTKQKFVKDPKDIKLFKPEWLFFGDNYLLDPVDGFLANIEIDYNQFVDHIPHKNLQFEFFLRRSLKIFFFKVFRSFVLNEQESDPMIRYFDIINGIYFSESPSNMINTNNNDRTKDSDNKKGNKRDNKDSDNNTKKKNKKKPSRRSTLTIGNTNKKKRKKKLSMPSYSTNQLLNTKNILNLRKIDDHHFYNKNDKSQIYQKSSIGYLVLNQNDFIEYFFNPLSLEQRITNNQLIELIFQYIWSLTIYQFEIDYRLFKLLIDLLVQSNNFQFLDQLIQNNFFLEKIDLIIEYLRKLEKIQPKLFFLVLDLLKKKKKFPELVKLLINRGKIFEALQYLDKIKENLPLIKYTFRRVLDMGDIATIILVFEFLQPKVTGKIFTSYLQFFFQFISKSNPKIFIQLFEEMSDLIPQRGMSKFAVLYKNLKKKI